MLLKENRLKKMKDFDILFKEGRFVNDELVNMKIWRIEPDKYPKRDYKIEDLKIGFVVSTKIVKSAVKRNRLKRQMREVVRLLLKADKLKVGFHIIIMAKVNIVGKNYSEIESSVVNVLKKGGVLL